MLPTSSRQPRHQSAAHLLSLLGAALLFAQTSSAQALPTSPPATSKTLYVDVPQMPELPTGGGKAALTAAVQRNVRFPAAAQRQGVQGTVTVAFTVETDGSLTDLYAQGVDYGCPEAAVAAVRLLPRLKPGRRLGQPVPVRMSLPVVFVLAGVTDRQAIAQAADAATAAADAATRNPQKPLAQPDTSRVVLYAQQMPRLPDGNGSYAVEALLQKTLVSSPDASASKIEGRVFVRFTVGASGVIRDAVVVKPLSAEADAAALRAVARLPRFQPGLQNGQPVAVSLTVPLTFYSVNHVYSRAPTSKPVPPVQNIDSLLAQNLRVPAAVAAQQLNGRVGVAAVVLPDGRLDSLRVVRPLCPSCDAEALRLVRLLPRYQPGRDEAGRAVAVRQYFEIRMPPNPPDSISRVYTYVEQMAALPAAPGNAGIMRTLQELLEPAARGERRAFVSFTVGPHGSVYDAKIVKGVSATADAAALRAVARLPRFVPGKQNGRPVPVSFMVPVLVK